MKYQNFICPYELALKLHELGVNSESEFYFVKEMKGGGCQRKAAIGAHDTARTGEGQGIIPGMV